MKPNRILLAVRPTLLRELLAHIVDQETDTEFVGQIDETDPVSLLLAIGRTEANILIHAESNVDDPEMFASGYTHLFAEYPGLIIVRIDPEQNTACAYQQTIKTTPLPSTALSDVISSLRPLVAAA